MTSSPEGTRAWLIRAGLLGVGLLALLVTGEIVARARGGFPWRPSDANFTVEPGGRFYQPHPTLGYQSLPGRFRIALRTGYRFAVTNGPDTLRITHSPRAEGKPRPQVWILGCSITYGWSVNDAETFPWQLQDHLPDKEVVNFGVNGYGTLHSLIQLREGLARGGAPEIVVLAYGQIHDERNTLSRLRRKTIASGNRMGPLEHPFARLDGAGRLQAGMAHVTYTEFPFMRYSALSHWIEGVYNYHIERPALASREVTLAILEKIVALTAANRIPLVVAGIRSERFAEVAEWARARNVPAPDISVNHLDRRYNNLPHDAHPTARAHSEHASRLYASLVELGLVD